MKTIYDAMHDYTISNQNLGEIESFLEQGQVDFPCCDDDPAWLYAMACGDLEPFKLCLKFKSVLDFDAYTGGSVLETAISRQIAYGDEDPFLEAVLIKASQEAEANGQGLQWLSGEIKRLIKLG